MDPNANLQEQESILADPNNHNHVRPWRLTNEAADRLWELRQALKDWLALGGSEPNWDAAPNARRYFGK